MSDQRLEVALRGLLDFVAETCIIATTREHAGCGDVTTFYCEICDRIGTEDEEHAPDCLIALARAALPKE